MHIQTVFGLVCDVMSVMQLSIMEHDNGINLKEKLVRFAIIEEKFNGISFEHNFLMPIRTIIRTEMQTQLASVGLAQARPNYQH